MNHIKLVTKIVEGEGMFALKLPDWIKPEVQKLLKFCHEKHGGYVLFDLRPVQKKKTLAQNKAFHAILAEFWKSGLHSYSTINELKIYMKTCDLTQCFESYQKDDKTIINIKSMSDYTVEETKNSLDYLISTCHQAGLNTKKFDEIMLGLNG